MPLNPDAPSFTELRPSSYSRRVDFRMVLFEARSTFTRVPARMVAESPKATLGHRSASVHFITSMTRRGGGQPER